MNKCTQCNMSGYVYLAGELMACPVCKGNGYYQCLICKGAGRYTCGMCGGKGHLDCLTCGGSGGPTVSNTVTNDAGECPSCNGSGSFREDCEVCQGEGKIKVEQ